MDLSTDRLVELATDATDLDAGTHALPVGLWGRIAHTIENSPAEGADSDGTRRHRGWSTTGTTPEAPDARAAAPISALDAFVRTAGEFGALLASLSAQDWQRRTRIDDNAVRSIVEHLTGMERYVLGQLGRGPAFAADGREDHWPATRQAAHDLTDVPDDDVAAAWWIEVMALVSACAEIGPDHAVRYHHLAGNVRSLLVSRTFELWTHGDDIRMAVGAPLDLLDEERLSLMVSELMAALPLGAALTGHDLPGRTVRFDVTGPGSGTFDVPLKFGEAAGEPDLVLATDSISLCRVAANRLGPEHISLSVRGDESLVGPVLEAAGAFAAD